MPVERAPQALVFALLLATLGQAWAEEPKQAPPDPELLEFIAGFTTDEGEWVDPFELDATTPPEESTEEVHQ